MSTAENHNIYANPKPVEPSLIAVSKEALSFSYEVYSGRSTEGNVSRTQEIPFAAAHFD